MIVIATHCSYGREQPFRELLDGSSPTTVDAKYPHRPAVLHLTTVHVRLGNMNRTLALTNPITYDTSYFGGI